MQGLFVRIPPRLTASPAVSALLLVLLMLAASIAVAREAEAGAGQSAEALFPALGTSDVRISPSGIWISASAQRGRVHGLLVQRSGQKQVEVVVATEEPQLGSWWVDDDTLIALFSTEVGRVYMIARLAERDGAIQIHRSRVAAIGWLVDPLPLEGGELLWAFDYKDRTSLHRVTLDDLENFRDERTARGHWVLPGAELASVDGSARRWVIDRDGRPRAAIRYEDEGYQVLVYEAGRSSYRIAREVDYSSSSERDLLIPVGVRSDGEKLIVLAYHDGNTIGLFEFDPTRFEIGERILQRPDVDIAGVRYDDLRGQLIAAVYEEEGEPRFHYFESYGELFLGDLAKQFPAESVEVVSGSRDRRIFAFRVSSATNPGVYYYRNAGTGETLPIASESSSVDRKSLVEVEAFSVKSADGLEIEAFLAVPRRIDGEASPLVVMPHGGPYGVRDNRRYDPLVQYLASWGFAVLQPNYRGSGGYGLEFLEAGKKQWAERIEDDIDAAVEWAMARPEIDGDRICIVGGSYGGFSALASVVRHAQRYRCAISWNGVSDIPLLYESSDVADSERHLDFYRSYVGDPETEREKLIAVSPAYHVEEIETPILVLFGDEDRRVDPDHSHRVLLMLETLGKEHDSLEIRGMAHGPDRAEGIIVARAMRRYLTRYLFAGTPFVEDPEFSAASDASFRPEVRLDR